MNRIATKETLKKAEKFFKDTIAKNHLKNVRKLTSLKEFSYNPFILTYLANFLTGNSSPESMAKVLVYSRALGTSISTSFGQNTQRFCSQVLSGSGTFIHGTDIEFIDKIDGRKKYCQVKAGPDTINKDGIATITNYFTSTRNLARQNSANLGINDLVIGILYGTPGEFNAHYRVLSRTYPVYIGQEFWHRLTGDKDFYVELIKTFSKAAEKTNASKLLKEVIKKLAEDIRKTIPQDK